MTKRIAILVIVLVLVLISTAACRANEDQVIAQQSSQQTNAGMSAEKDGDETGTSNKASKPEMDQKQVERGVQKMKENGIVDKNGKPAPGVDLNDYPGLG